MLMKTLCYTLFCCVAALCPSTPEGEPQNNKETFPKKGEKNIGAAKLVFSEPLTVSAERISMAGTWITDGKKLLFADRKIVPTSIYSPEGVFEKSIFVKGNGPHEIICPAFAVLPLRDGGYIYLNEMSQIHYFNSSLRIQSSSFLLKDLIKGSDMNDLLRHPDPKVPAMYEHEVYGNKLAELGEYVIFPVSTEHRYYNGFMRNAKAKDFYQNSYTLMAMKKNDLSKFVLFGHFPPIYNTRMLPNFMERYVCSDGNHLFVSYEADPLIYAYDSKLQSAYAFGVAGVNVKDDYPQVTSLEQHEETTKKHHAQYGHYLKMIYGDGYLLRQYKRPGAKNALQVYKGSTLICDEEMPYKQFELVGYIAPYFYAVVDVDYEYETYKMLRFKIE